MDDITQVKFLTFPMVATGINKEGVSITKRNTTEVYVEYPIAS